MPAVYLKPPASPEYFRDNVPDVVFAPGGAGNETGDRRELVSHDVHGALAFARLIAAVADEAGAM